MVASATLTNARINLGSGMNPSIVNPSLSIFPEEIPSVNSYIKDSSNNLRSGMTTNNEDTSEFAFKNAIIEKKEEPKNTAHEGVVNGGSSNLGTDDLTDISIELDKLS